MRCRPTCWPLVLLCIAAPRAEGGQWGAAVQGLCAGCEAHALISTARCFVPGPLGPASLDGRPHKRCCRNDAEGMRLTCCLLGVWMYVPVRPLADTPHARLRIRPVHTVECLHDFPLARMLHSCRHYCAAVVVDFWLLRLRLRCQLWRLCSAVLNVARCHVAARCLLKAPFTTSISCAGLW